MPSIPPPLQVKLDAGVTTLCRCWTIKRRDGVTLGFTDHDEDIMLGDVACHAGTGLTASEATARLGLAIDGSEIAGALAAESLVDADLAAGRFDAADIELYIVDWSEPSLRVLAAKGALGEVRREGAAFSAEFRGLTHRLAEEHGRIYTARCGADLGDARCGVDLAQASLRGEGAVAAVRAASHLLVLGLDAYAADWFTAGRLSFASGANAGNAVEVKTHRVTAEGVTIDLWQAMPEAVAVGDLFVVAAGCDKRFETCRDRFANAANFRGFPHIPGNDFVIRYPVPGEPGHDGKSVRAR